MTVLMLVLSWSFSISSSAQTVPRIPGEMTLKVNEWGDIKRLEFSGLTTFSTNGVINGLLQSPQFLLASHPAAPLDEYAPTLAKLVEAGYRAHGFRDVQVKAELDESGKRVMVKIQEGTRFRAGKIRFENPGALPVAELIRILTSPQTAKAADQPEGDMFFPKKEDAPWAVNEPVGFDKNTASRIEEAVRVTLGKAGYLFCKFSIRLEEEPGTQRASLVVVIENTGALAKLGNVEVTGLKNHTPQELLQWLDIRTGQPMTIDFIPALQQKMEDSGRFLRMEFTPAQLPGNDGGLDLKIAVKELADAPRLNARLTPAQGAMLRTSAWIRDAFSRGTEFRYEGTFNKFNLDMVGLTISGTAEIVFRRDAFAMLWRREGQLVRGLLATTNGILYVSPATGRKLEYAWTGGASVQAEFGVKPNPEAEDDDVPFNTGFKFGFQGGVAAGKSPVEMTFHIAPGVMLHELHKANERTQLVKDKLTVTTTNRLWTVHASTGALIEGRSTATEAEGSMTYRLLPDPGAIARIEQELKTAAAGMKDQLHPEQPLASLLALTVAEYAEAPLASQILTNVPFLQHLPAASQTVQRLLLSGVLKPFEPPAPTEAKGSGESAFVIPDESAAETVKSVTQKLWSYIAAVIFRYSNEYLPAQSWPATLAREGVMLMAGNPKYAEPELTRIAQSPDTGPIGCLVASHLLAFVGNSDAAAQFANLGLTRLDQPHFERDATLLLEIADRVLAKSNQKLEPITSISPQELKAIDAVLPASIGRFIQSGVAALKLKPGEGTRQTLLPLLTDAWHAGLKNDIATRLKQASANANKRQESERLFNLALALHTGSEGTTDLPRAIALYQEALKLGSAPAAYQLGTLHQSGQGLEADMTKAVEYYGKAAEQGLVIAQVKLAELYMLGLDVKKDLQAALLWYRVAELGGAQGARGMANMISRQLTPEQNTEVIEKIQKHFPQLFQANPAQK